MSEKTDQLKQQALESELEDLKAENEQLKAENASLKNQTLPHQQDGGTSPSAKKQGVKLTASSTKGTIGGQASGKCKATLLDKDGEPIEGETIFFKIDGKDLGQQITDGNGVAEIDSGSHLGDPLLWGKALSNGYQAVFNGTKEYKPASANATVEPGIF
ncbi:hypothetical protein ACIBK8_22150 [Streptomyces sp. NPDC050161]|uniref:hypothetical protein n=1 Tax=Streptomyces sp. NPDC050161 TaxID=3365604 RepID=UPI00378D65C9